MIFISSLFLLVSNARSQDSSSYNFSAGLQIGAFRGYIFDSYAVSPSLQLVVHTKVLDIGLHGGFRHRAYGREWIDPLGRVLPNNLVEAKERAGQFNDPSGDIELTYFTSRFFQSYLHLYLNKSLWHYQGFSINLGLSPGFEYADIIAPISSESVNFINERPVAGSYYLYEVAYKRYIAFGILGKIDISYVISNKYISAGYERGHYFEGNRYDNLFLGIGIRLIEINSKGSD